MKENIENLNEWTSLYKYYGLLVNIEIYYKVSKLANHYTIELTDKLRNGSLLVTGKLFDNQEEIDAYLNELKQQLENLTKEDRNLELFV